MKNSLLLIVIFCLKGTDLAYLGIDSFTVSSHTVSCGEKVTFSCTADIRPGTIPMVIAAETSNKEVKVETTSKVNVITRRGGSEVEVQRTTIQGTKVMGRNESDEYICYVGYPKGKGPLVARGVSVSVTLPCNAGTVFGISSALLLIFLLLSQV